MGIYKFNHQRKIVSLQLGTGLNYVCLLFILLMVSCQDKNTQVQEDKNSVHDLSAYVNVFFGVDRTSEKSKEVIAENLPRIDTSWYNVREIYGATHPGAALPFGMVSTNATGLSLYKKGHPTGYDGKGFYGISHFHASGPGTIRWYGNYFLFSPRTGVFNFERKKQIIVDEQGAPGSYSCTLDSGIKVRSTVAQKAAMHQFEFPENKEANLLIDLSNYYAAIDSARVVPENFPQKLLASLVSPTEVSGKVVMDGFPFYFYLELDQTPKKTEFFVNGEKTENDHINIDQHTKNTGLAFNFENEGAQTVTARIGFSFKSEQQAKSNLRSNIDTWKFDEIQLKARNVWNGYLSKFSVEDASDSKKQLFYTSLYKTLLKPANLSGENPFWENDRYWVDFATSWDIYATQLPFVFSFYPEEGAEIAQFYVDLFEQFGRYPPAYLMKEGMPWVFSKQASALGNFILADAKAKQLQGIDWERSLDAMVGTINNERGLLFQQSLPLAPSPTHNQDYAYAAFCAGQVAKAMGRDSLALKMKELGGLWKSVYDKEGILQQVDRNALRETELYPKQHWDYYEGNRWNYTYRIWQDMEGLIAAQGGKEAFLKNLDWYHSIIPNNTVNQFQGLNNEVDYCAPYAYLYAGRPDRTQQIVRTALEYRFDNTRGGLPGNDDAGAMTSWYLWNSMGLFPIAGQDILLIGSPTFKSLTINRKNPFTVETLNNSTNNIYVQRAFLNGKALERPFLYFKEFEAGGKLLLEMGDVPSDWGSSNPPPSYY